MGFDRSCQIGYPVAVMEDSFALQVKGIHLRDDRMQKSELKILFGNITIEGDIQKTAD